MKKKLAKNHISKHRYRRKFLKCWSAPHGRKQIQNIPMVAEKVKKPLKICKVLTLHIKKNATQENIHVSYIIKV